jgi:predicted nucleic acid-binding protein
MIFIDTNLLLYAISSDPGEKGKTIKAKAILGGADLALSVQVLQEFYVQATRPTRPDPLNHQEAAVLIQHWLRHHIVPLTVPLMQAALRIKDRYQTSYWDAAILAAADTAGCTELLSEDLNPGQSYDAVRVINPFQ